jgi:UDPglucose 6-dehydrogenase
MNIAVVGMGYVGLSNALLLSQHNEVIAIDINSEKIDMLKRKKSPFEDVEITEYLRKKTSTLKQLSINMMRIKMLITLLLRRPLITT